MPTLAEVRQKYPQYDDMSDDALANALHSKFYSDMPRDVFNSKIGFGGTIETPVGAPLSSVQRLLAETENAGPTASQRTSPDISRYNGRFLGEATIGEGGDIFYKDPNTGQPVPTDQNKQVAIRDPRDGRLKVFSRSEDTNTSMATGLGQILAPGLATGPPAQRLLGGVRNNDLTTLGKLIDRFKPAAAPIATDVGSTIDEVAQAAKRLTDSGRPIDVPHAIASDNLLTQQVGAGLSNMPVLGAPLVRAAEKTVGQLENAVGDIARAQGGATAEGAGRTATQPITEWIRGTKDPITGANIPGRSQTKVTQAYNAVDDAIDPSVRIGLENTRGAVADILAKRQNAHIGDSSAVNKVIEAVQTPEGMNYYGVKHLRTYIGELKDKGSLLPADISGQEVENIYKALTKDLGAVSEAAGGARGKFLWEHANRLNTSVMRRREELLSLVGNGKATPAEVLDNIRRAATGTRAADTDLLLKAKKIVGDDWDGVVSAITAHLGQNTQGNFAPGQFLRDWEKLSSAGKSALYGTGAHREALDSIATIASRWPQLQKFQNPSGTARTAAIIGTALHPLSAIAMLFDPTVVGGLAATAYAAKRLAAPVTVADALAKPATAASTAAWTRAYERAVRSPSPAAMAQLTVQSRNLANTYNSQLGTSISPGDLLKAIQGPGPARSGEEQ